MIYFITGNKKKLKEAQAIMDGIEQLDIDLPEIQETDAHQIIKEKLLEGLKHHQGGLIVEDTSLYFDALNGLPGPLIKWFLNTLGTTGLYELVDKYGNYKAYAKTIIGYAANENEIRYFEGVIEGEIVPPLTEVAFGWDPIFKPLGYDKTFAEMDEDEKNAISMRKIAFSGLKAFLDTKN